MPFNQHSNDAMFAKIITRLEAQDAVLRDILEQVKRTNGRVTKLETQAFAQKCIIYSLSGLISFGITIAGFYFKH